MGQWAKVCVEERTGGQSTGRVQEHLRERRKSKASRVLNEDRGTLMGGGSPSTGAALPAHQKASVLRKTALVEPERARPDQAR